MLTRTCFPVGILGVVIFLFRLLPSPLGVYGIIVEHVGSSTVAEPKNIRQKPHLFSSSLPKEMVKAWKVDSEKLPE
ncbi:hypothetical protein ACFX19_029166 [Malus domestica]